LYLKNIDLQGFKSFADKISLDFSRGITAVVGPNGSGKSNISDAVRWVMGEQSAKTLRGHRMDDVIFAGTEARKPVGFAEVSLTIDNEERLFPIDFPEIIVTRRVYRSGESEYYINKTSCRLKDIHEMFMDTGIGRDGYSIIGQGKIDEILSTKSEDRRQLFEEAAGITKYKYRKTEAERKLASTEDNLTRLRDIMAEIEANLGPLEAQSTKAKKFLDLREELKVLELNVSVDTIDKLKKLLSEIDQTFETASEQLETAKAQIENQETESQNMFALNRETDVEMEQCREREKGNEASINACANDINIFETNIAHNKENVERITTEIAEAQNEIKVLDNDYAQNEKVLKEYMSLLAESEQLTTALQSQLDEVMKIANDKNSEIESWQSDVIEKRSEINSARAATANLNILLTNYTDRSGTLDSEIDAKSIGAGEISSRISNLESALKSDDTKLNEQKEKIEKLRQDEIAARNDFDKFRGEKNILSADLNAKQSKKSMLEDMERNFEGYTKSVKGIMQAAASGQLKDIKVHAPVSQLLKVDNKFGAAIEVALGSTAQNIVVETEADAKRAIEYLKRGNLGRATFLPISAVKGNEMDDREVSQNKGFLGLASRLVTCDNKYDGVLKNLLGRIAVFEDIDSAIAAAKKSGYKYRIVTLTGELLSAGGAMTGGSRNQGSGFISRANEAAKLGEEIENLEKHLQDNDKNIAKTGDNVNKLSKEIGELAISINSLEQQKIKNTSDLEHLKENLQNIEKDVINLNTEKATIGIQTAKINADISDKDTGILKLDSEISAIEAKMSIGNDEFSKISARQTEINDKLIAQSIKHNSVLKDIEMQNERLSVINGDKRELLADIEQKNQQITEFGDKCEDLTDDIDFKRQQIEDLNEEKAALLAKMDELATTKTKTDEKIRELQESSKDMREELFKAQNEHARIENRRTRAELELETVINRIWEEYELTYSSALEYKKDIGSITAANKRIETLRDEIRDLGNINIDAIEEYKSTKERFEFMTVQIDDLSRASEDLQKIIREMVLIMQEQFSEKFKVINHHFSEVFADLFGGGRASISLTNLADILESGIEIEAQPPGKKLQTLSLLSGGERALTAIALLFAILKTRPTPFCILDEIEAALDDVNVHRFADYLKKKFADTQFIVITHKRGTMEVATGLYGVTMQEKGVSKLLSLDLDSVAV